MDENKALSIIQQGKEQMQPTTMAGSMLRKYTRLERLQAEKIAIEARLRLVNEAIQAIESNPEVMRIFEAVDKVI